MTRQLIASALSKAKESNPEASVRAGNRGKAQGSIGRTVGGNTGGEQRTLRRNKAPRLGRSGHFGGRRANSEGVGTLVTGNPLPERETLRRAQHLWEKSGVRRSRFGAAGRQSAGNRVNPMVVCGVQQTRKALCGVNRRSREERQGRNAFEAWQPRALACQEWTHREHDGGAIFEKPQERSLETAVTSVADATRAAPTWRA